MGIPVGINGFGRIGRVVLRIILERGDGFDLRGINLRKADLDYMEYMVKYDSVFHTFQGTQDPGIQSERRGADPMERVRRTVHRRIHRGL